MAGERSRAVPKVGGQCPAGYYSSGGYCREMPRDNRGIGF
jgi:hypothetical protein